ncbi:unnamed protein product [Lactuca virosa]|uniref:Uncharacterized protein n=1 Tax=Lactuca virosa TaxID=75947 RepID=A0AAU9NIX9_9ASTR|nr:unnamed protein product [Lactuca virosa]
MELLFSSKDLIKCVCNFLKEHIHHHLLQRLSHAATGPYMYFYPFCCLSSSNQSTIVANHDRLTLLFLELRSDVWGFICAEGNGEGKQLHGKEKQQQGEIEAKFLLAFILKVSDDFNMIPPLLRLEIRKLFAQVSDMNYLMCQ